MKQNFGKYRIIKELGKGAMGVVYLAFDPVLEREVAIKTISSTEADKDLRERFIREARSAGRLRHNNIITIYDFGEEDGQLYIAMEYLEGRDLDSIIASKPQLDLKDKLAIMHQMCLGLDYAHRNSIYHRDIKPANIKVLSDGTIKIMDFGLATMQTSGLTKTGTIMGTPHYMSPEMVQGAKVDGRSDQFAVGVIFYELLTYKRPFTGDNISTILYKILNTEPQAFQDNLTSQYPELQGIIEKAMQKNPEQRYQTIKQMAEDIDRLRHKILTKGFHMTEPTVVIDDTMDTVLMDTELDYTSIKKKEKKSKTPVYTAIAGLAFIAVLALLYFFVLKGPAPVFESGFLTFDVKPYAKIEKLENIKTGEKILLNENNRITPVRIALNPGEYRITYNHDSWGGNKRTEVFEITAGRTTKIKDVLNKSFATEATEHFTIHH